MCMTIIIECQKLLEPKVAKKDIVCWKLMATEQRSEREYVSYFYGYVYELNRKEALNKPMEVELKSFDLSTRQYQVGAAFHSYKITKKARTYIGIKHGILVECIIPKGAKYYEGVNGMDECYTSDSIVPLRVLDKVYESEMGIRRLVKYKLNTINNRVRDFFAKLKKN